LFRRGFGTFKEKPGPCILFSVAFNAVSYLPTLFANSFFDPNDPDLGGVGPFGGLALLIVVPLFQVLVLGPLAVGYNWVFLRLARGENPDFPELFAGFQRYGVSVGVFVLFGIAVTLGTLALVVPGIIIAMGFFAALYLVLDDDRGPLDTLARSWEITRGHKGGIFFICLIMAVIGIPLFFGLSFLGEPFLWAGLALVAGPIAAAVVAAMYDELAGKEPAPAMEEQEPLSD
jgi:uncharacterized membrane protein